MTHILVMKTALNELQMSKPTCFSDKNLIKHWNPKKKKTFVADATQKNFIFGSKITESKSLPFSQMKSTKLTNSAKSQIKVNN